MPGGRHPILVDEVGRSIDVRITRIHRIVERDRARPQGIKTMRGAGYVFVLTGYRQVEAAYRIRRPGDARAAVQATMNRPVWRRHVRHTARTR